MLFHENRLPADVSHEISCLFLLFLKKPQNLKLSSAANYRLGFMGLLMRTTKPDKMLGLIWISGTTGPIPKYFISMRQYAERTFQSHYSRVKVLPGGQKSHIQN